MSNNKEGEQMETDLNTPIDESFGKLQAAERLATEQEFTGKDNRNKILGIMDEVREMMEQGLNS